MNLAWYSWLALVGFTAVAVHDSVVLVINARRQVSTGEHVLWVAVWWTAAIAVALNGAWGR